MTMKRRIIYMSDDTWEIIRDASAGQGITMSEVIRRAMLRENVTMPHGINSGAAGWEVIPETPAGPRGSPPGTVRKGTEQERETPVERTIEKPVVDWSAPIVPKAVVSAPSRNPEIAEAIAKLPTMGHSHQSRPAPKIPRKK